MLINTTNLTTSKKVTYVVTQLAPPSSLESTKLQLLRWNNNGIKSYQSNLEHLTKHRKELLQALGKGLWRNILKDTQQSTAVCKSANVRSAVQNAPSSYLLGNHQVQSDGGHFVQNYFLIFCASECAGYFFRWNWLGTPGSEMFSYW